MSTDFLMSNKRASLTFYQYVSVTVVKTHFKENILRSQEKSKERKVKEGNSLNLESIVFDLPNI